MNTPSECYYIKPSYLVRRWVKTMGSRDVQIFLSICVVGLLKEKIKITHDQDLFIVSGKMTKVFLSPLWNLCDKQSARWLTWSLSLFSHKDVHIWHVKQTLAEIPKTWSWKPLPLYWLEKYWPSFSKTTGHRPCSTFKLIEFSSCHVSAMNGASILWFWLT